jgi:class 3 adenylate cyclase/predicted ATPase
VDVGAWLRGLGLGQYEQAFRDNDVDARVLRGLTAEDLREIGVASVGHRRLILQAIAGMCAAPPPAAPAATVEADVAPAAHGSARAERRQLTVMFVDLVGSTALSARLDPEETREVIRAYQNAVAGEVARLEGHVAKFMGDGVLAYFGWPTAHEDEAERAVRAGLAVVRAVAGLTAPGAEPLRARVGIATGLVVVGDPVGEGAAREEAVVGGTPNLAARLQGLAEPGTVVVAEATQRLLGQLFEFAALGACELKGFAEPVRAWRVLGPGRAESRFEARHAGGPLPLVGREQELGLLLDRWRQARGDEGQVVLLCGEPGIGKSRIVLALHERLGPEPRTGLRYHGSPYHANSALWPVIDQIERAAGLAPDDPPEAKLTKLERLLGRAVGDVSAATPLVAELLSVPSAGRYPPLDLTPQQRKAGTFRVLLEQFEGLAGQKPALMVLEDAQWFDATSLELFGLVVERIQRLPVLLVATFRPEFRPPWTGHAHVTLLTLTRLGRGAAAEVVAQVTGGRALPDGVLAQIVAKADGIPLFVEELTKAVLESGLLYDVGGRYELAVDPLPPLAIPATLHDSLMARLDRLAPVREVAQVGAVIGREFSEELLAAVADMDPAELADGLRQLVEAELVFRRGVPPETTYVFKHALVQDAAYASLLKSRRQQLHARIAEALTAGEAPEPAPELLAWHLTEAGLDERASEAWARAGLAALGRSAMTEAAAAFERAVGLLRELPPSAERKRREVELLGRLGVALANIKGPASAEVERVQERAGALAAELGDTQAWFRARWTLWRIHAVRAQLDQATAIADDLLALADRESLADLALQAHHALWSSYFYRGDLAASHAHVERGLAIYDVARHGSDALVFGGHDARECGLTISGNVLCIMGYPERALACNKEGLAHALALGQPQIVAHGHNWSVLLPQLVGDLEEVERRIAFMRPHVDRYALAMYYPEARIMEAWLAVCHDRDRRAAEVMREHLDRRAAMGTASAQTWFLMLIADAWLRLGEPGAALAAVREGLARGGATGEHLVKAELHRLGGRALLVRNARCNWADAEAEFLTALTDARGRSARLFELRAACDLAHLWADGGERRRAHDLLTPIYGWFTEGFDTPDLRDARALLDGLQ